MMGVTGAQSVSAVASTTMEIRPRLELRSRSTTENVASIAVTKNWSLVSFLTWPVWILDEGVDDRDGLVAEPGPGLGSQGGQADHGAHGQSPAP